MNEVGGVSDSDFSLLQLPNGCWHLPIGSLQLNSGFYRLNKRRPEREQLRVSNVPAPLRALHLSDRVSETKLGVANRGVREQASDILVGRLEVAGFLTDHGSSDNTATDGWSGERWAVGEQVRESKRR